MRNHNLEKVNCQVKKIEYLINSVSENNLLKTCNTPLTSLRKILVMDTIINMDNKVTFKKMTVLLKLKLPTGNQFLLNIWLNSIIQATKKSILKKINMGIRIITLNSDISKT